MAGSLLICFALLLSSGCSWNNASTESAIVPGNSILVAPTKNISDAATNSSNGINMTGILTSKDTDKSKLQFIDISSGSEYEITYSTGTDFKTAYGNTLLPALMKVGELYDINCSKTGLANTITKNKDAWERTSVTDISLNEDSKTVTVGSSVLKYDSFALIMDDSKRISIAKILSVDELTLRGIGDKLYSVEVTKGHGYLSFTGDDAFVGGYVTVGDKFLYGVTGNMIVTVTEGIYSVEMSNNGQSSTKTVSITKNQQSTLDFSEYTTAAPKKGTVKFSITPSGAVLTIDGVETDYSSPIELSYGSHTIKVDTNYYEEYTETFTVNTSYQTKFIDLEANSSVTTSSSKTTSSTTSSSKTTSSTTAAKTTTTVATTDLTAGYTVNVSTPEGAALYVDSVYMGIIPCSFSKSSGNKTVTLTKSGYTTVSYTINIANAAGDLTYAFPDMVASSTSTTTTTSN